MSDAIKRLREHARNWRLTQDRADALLDVAEAAQLYLTDHSEETGEALVAALERLADVI